MALIESYIYAGLTVELHLEDHPNLDCPLTYLDDSLQFVTFERNSSLADYHEYDSPDHLIFPDAGTTFPLYKYEHGGVVYAITPFTCPWDSGRVGAIFVGQDYPDAEVQAKNLCEQVSSWCNGEVYGYLIRDKEGEQLDSCWGFLGDVLHCKFEADCAARDLVADLKDKNQKQLKIEIRNRVPLQNRKAYVDRI